MEASSPPPPHEAHIQPPSWSRWDPHPRQPGGGGRGIEKQASVHRGDETTAARPRAQRGPAGKLGGWGHPMTGMTRQRQRQRSRQRQHDHPRPPLHQLVAAPRTHEERDVRGWWSSWRRQVSQQQQHQRQQHQRQQQQKQRQREYLKTQQQQQLASHGCDGTGRRVPVRRQQNQQQNQQMQ